MYVDDVQGLRATTMPIAGAFEIAGEFIGKVHTYWLAISSSPADVRLINGTVGLSPIGFAHSRPN